MIRYQGTKTLRALPMTRGEYNAYRGWELPISENPQDPGYLVEYEDGGAANDPRHAGYISWSPAAVFEGAYTPITTPEDRMRLEIAELRARYMKLGDFIKTDTFLALPSAMRVLLVDQETVMAAYLGILDKRLALMA